MRSNVALELQDCTKNVDLLLEVRVKVTDGLWFDCHTAFELSKKGREAEAEDAARITRITISASIYECTDNHKRVVLLHRCSARSTKGHNGVLYAGEDGYSHC